MAKFNTKFELSVSDMTIIEDALRASKLAKTQEIKKKPMEKQNVRE
ncbi:MAG: hypothetical protein HOJ51_15655, partial [Tateyamaria sp.]|nr:hypothetical protein [Tateyamaria sp.]